MGAAKSVVVIACGVIAAIYLMYPSGGLFEFIPDFIPVIGNMDEAAATVILVGVFRYFGFDVSRLFVRDRALPDNSRKNRG